MLARIGNLTPERAQRLNLAGDVAILTIASCSAAWDQGTFHYKIALVMAATAATLWILASRALRHYDVWNGRGFLGDVALTLVLLAAVIVPMVLLRFAIPRYAMTTQTTRFLAVLLPAILWLRVKATGLRLWNARPEQRILVVGIGPLGRLTGGELRDSGKRLQVIGHVRLTDEPMHTRLHAPVLGTVNDF